MLAAQDAISPFEGTSHHYQVEQHEGSSYHWQVFQELVPLVVADGQSYDFLSGEGSSSVEVQWLKAGVYYLLVTEFNPAGCNNLKAIRVEVIPNSLQLAVSKPSSKQCYEASGNDFTVDLHFRNNKGAPLEEEHFPVELSFSINGITQAPQTITYFNQQLAVDEQLFQVDPNQSTSVTVVLQQAVDAKNLTIQPRDREETHQRHFLPRPNLSFRLGYEQLPIGISRSFEVVEQKEWAYSWSLTKPDGTELSLNSTTWQTEELQFDQLGTYLLFVQAGSQNNCLGTKVSKSIEIVAAKPPLLAVDDQFATSTNQQLVISILENDLGVEEQTQVLIPQITAAGGSINFSRENGMVIYNPPLNYTGEDRFTYELCDNQESADCSQAEVIITVEPTHEEALKPIAVHDINIGWIDQQIEGNVLTNDLFYQGTSFSLEVVTIPDEKAGKLTAFDRQTGAYVFEPASDYVGEAIFEYQICKQDGAGNSQCDKAMVTIQIVDYHLDNMSLVANSDVVVAKINQAVSGNFLLNDFDAEGDPFFIQEVRHTNLRGILDWTENGEFSYTPEPDFEGVVSFNYTICDALGQCSDATVSIYMLPEQGNNQLLTAIDDVFFSVEQGIVTGHLAENDQGIDQLDVTYTLVQEGAPQFGQLTINGDGDFEYYPQQQADSPYVDQFVYRTCSAVTEGSCSYATAYILVNPVAPLAVIDAEKIEAGACLSVVLDGSLSEGQGQLTYAWSPSSFLNDATSPKPSLTAGESAWYYLTVSDWAGRSHTDSVYVEVVDAPQTILDDQLYVSKPTDVIMLDASDSSGEQLTFNWWTEGEELILSGEQTPNPEVSGLGTYYLEVTDRFGCAKVDSVVVGLLLQVEAVNDTLELLINTFADINVLRNDLPKGQLNPQSVSIVSPPEHGVAIVSSDSIITYTPDQFYVGKDNFVYAVCDFDKQCDEAMVLVMINNEPLFVPNAFSPNGDGINDYFEIIGLNQYERVRLRVVNRWGSLVYESLNYGNGSGRDGFWDGIANKGVRTGDRPVPTGTYYYVLDLGDGSEKLTGYIYIDR